MQNKETKKIESARKQKSPVPLIVISALLIVSLVGVFLLVNNRVQKTDYKNVKIGSEQFKLEIAETQEKREKGLSERDTLPGGTGMLFDFKADGDWRMWMVQMRFPIDIAWLDSDGKIVYIKHNAQPGDYPEIYHAGSASRYVIEVPANTFRDQSVQAGDLLMIK